MGTKLKIKHILFVEDEEDPRTVISMFLESQGFKVTASTNGENALKKLNYFKREKVVVDLVITDLIMPWIGGLELIESMIQQQINIPVLIISAFANEVTEEILKDMSCKTILEKPFSPEKLLMEINKTLSC